MNRLAKYLARHNVPQEAFASASGVPAPMVSLYVSGKRRPGLDYAFAIERATGGEVPALYWTTVRMARRAKKARRVRRLSPVATSHL